MQNNRMVTILILVDGFLQSYDDYINYKNQESHNPYFSRWFSAMKTKMNWKNF